MDFFAAVGVPFESALRYMLLHFLLSLSFCLPYSLTLTTISPTLLESRTGASFTFLSCSFWALFLHCCVDFGWLGIADLMVMMGVKF